MEPGFENQHGVGAWRLPGRGLPPLAVADRIIVDPEREQLTIVSGLNQEPIEVRVLSRIETGFGDLIVRRGIEALKHHPAYLYEEGEHSALIHRGSESDPSAVYHLAVGEEALTWHRHPSCAHRIITVTTGSRGAVARFSLASEDEILRDPHALIEQMVTVELPPDAQICIRFNGFTYHQFGPFGPGSPAFVGVSVHKNERFELDEIKREGWAGALAEITAASIPLLTRCIPESARRLVAAPHALADVPRVQLGL